MTAPTARTSLWWSSRSPDLHDPVPPQSPPPTADVLVVGAGLTGLATAVLLARAGREPVVLEARRVGAGTTGHSTAKLSLLQGSVLQRVARHAGRDAVTAYVTANRVGQEWVLAELEAAGIAPEYRDAVDYAVTDAGARRVTREADVARMAGLPVVDVADPGLPFEVRAAALLRGQAQLDPLQVLDVLRAELEDRGVAVVEGVRVTGASWTRPWRVSTTAGEVNAPHLVLATQTPVLDRTLHFASTTAHRSYALAYGVTAPDAVPDAMFLSLDENTRSLRTVGGGTDEVLLVGGGDHVVGRAGPTARRVAELQDWAHRHLPVGQLRASWSAQDYRTARQVPSVGPVPGTDGALLVATGYDKWGMTNAVAAAHVLTGHLQGRPPAWAAGPTVRRVGLSDLADATRHNASVGSRWVGDRVRRVHPGRSDTVPPEGEGRVEGGPLDPVAVSTVDGVTRRVGATCPHMGGVLAWNDAEQSWDCPLHGSRFTADGTRIEGPATADLAPRGAVPGAT
jgi:glycine/D-amino acid oxidase-like deaminating enzyme/nitrite reductase/ring-hydroxylating ferredoxin subunit